MNKTRSILALALLVPAPSLGAYAAIVLFPNEPAGRMIFAFSKLWLLALPVIWLTCVERRPIRFPAPRRGGFGAGWMSGVGLSLLIGAGYAAGGASLFDRDYLIGRITAVGLGNPAVYLAGAGYWIVINSVLEEYVWRWFVYTKCADVVRPSAAVFLSALFFTLHHFIALSAYSPWTTAFLCSVGVFIGGAVWSGLYMKYRSIWPGCLSHALVDACVFGLGALLLFT